MSSGGAVGAIAVTTVAFLASAVAVVVVGVVVGPVVETTTVVVVVSDGLVEPAAVSAAVTSADFRSRGSSAWNERVRNRPPPVLEWDDDFDADLLGRRCHENNLRIVSPLKTK